MLTHTHLKVFQDRPDLFCKHILGEATTIDDVLDGQADHANAPTDKQIEIMHSVSRNKYTACPSGNNLGKSHIAARVALWFVLCYAPSIVIFTAPKQTQVRDILFARFRQAHKNSKVALGGEVLATHYYPNRDDFPNWFCIGMTARSEEAFSGWHEHNMLIILEEATGIPPHIFGGLEGMLSGEGVRLLEISNPTSALSDFGQHCKSPLYNTIHLDGLEHPNVVHQREIYKGAIAPGWPDEMEEKWGTDSAMYQVRVRGLFPTDEDGIIIPMHWIESAIDTDVPKGNATVIGVDVARKGSNKTVAIAFDGHTYRILFTEAHTDIAALADRLQTYTFHYLGIDDVGVGGGLVDILQQRGHRVLPFQANSVSDDEADRRMLEARLSQQMQGRVTPPPGLRDPQGHDDIKYKNLMSQAWWDTRTLFERTYKNPDTPEENVCIPNDAGLFYQLNARKFDTDNEVVNVLPKRDLEFDSDLADALVIATRTYNRTHLSAG